jgi:hypothetical protein
MILILFYYSLNRDIEWAAFILFLILDAGASFLGLLIILLVPITTSLSTYKYCNQYQHHEEREGLLADDKVQSEPY